ncbi:F0F1 ATP synthase subunit gamma [Candidatus Termititenax persephonae]|uniref:F0F1 ATP synthase subunit gamma n=1 Tax=Candidatus Termititenax persephonae TaxID=2218525 RepID=A0A388TH70_9BACT|nr:F0F1 ATP synthase subunit gamma [Candidatus Termititenax persephonae]
MSQLSLIKERLKTVANLHQVTKAMEMVTRTKINKVRQNANQAKNYQAWAAEVFAQISALGRAEPEESRGPTVRYYLAFFSHKGFCGGFNDKLLAQLQAALAVPGRGKLAGLYCLGRHSAKWAHYLGTGYTPMAAAAANYQTETAPILAELAAGIMGGQKVEVYFAYNALVSVLEQRPTITKIYPFDREPPRVCREIVLEPDYEQIYPEILRSYLAACLDKVYWESVAGEHYARLVSMQNANKNADLILHNLALQYNKTRQMRITQELSEVVSAFGVLQMTAAKAEEGVW